MRKGPNATSSPPQLRQKEEKITSQKLRIASSISIIPSLKTLDFVETIVQNIHLSPSEKTPETLSFLTKNNYICTHIHDENKDYGIGLTTAPRPYKTTIMKQKNQKKHHKG